MPMGGARSPKITDLLLISNICRLCKHMQTVQLVQQPLSLYLSKLHRRILRWERPSTHALQQNQATCHVHNANPHACRCDRQLSRRNSGKFVETQRLQYKASNSKTITMSHEMLNNFCVWGCECVEQGWAVDP
jgi:hypothetical protein